MENKTLKRFELIPLAKHATNLMFQQSQKTLGNLEQVKPWFSKKHENYDSKTKISVHAEGVAMMVMPQRPEKIIGHSNCTEGFECTY